MFSTSTTRENKQHLNELQVVLLLAGRAKQTEEGLQDDAALTASIHIQGLA